jgi:Tol biopolymer transport system component
VVRDTATGATVLASRADGPNGAPLTGEMLSPSVSADGRRVAFELRPPGDGPEQVWVRDLAAGRTELASRADGATGAPANGYAVAPQISADGKRVMFISNASNLGDGDTDTRRDVHVRDLSTGRTMLVNRATGADGAKSNNDVELAALSSDGSHVAFATAATNLGDGDTDGFEDVHVRDLAKGTTKLASVSSTGVKGDQNSTDPGISADGSRVSFGSTATTFSTQPMGGEQVWVHDFTTGKTILASRADGANGAPGIGDSFNTFLSANGQVVAFESEATNFFSGPRGDFEAYRRDLTANTTRLVSRGTGANGAAVPGFGGVPEGITADGACVTFEATGPLLGPAPGAADNVQVYMRTFKANCGRPGASGLGTLDKTAPVLRSASLSRTRFRVAKGRTVISSSVGRGTVLRLTSSEAGRLTIRIDRARAGRKVRRGTAYKKTATLTRTIKAGRVNVKLTGRIGRRKMAAAPYRLTLTLRDSAGNVSKPLRLRFTIIPG